MGTGSFVFTSLQVVVFSHAHLPPSPAPILNSVETLVLERANATQSTCNTRNKGHMQDIKQRAHATRQTQHVVQLSAASAQECA